MKPLFSPASRQQPCDICHGTHFEHVGDHDRKGRPLSSVICRDCGLVSHERIPSDEELSEYYLRQYRSDYHGEYTPSAYRVIRAWKRGEKLAKRLRPFLKPDSQIFEVGCGIGGNLKHLEFAGHQVAGIEPGEGFGRFAREHLRIAASQQQLEDVSYVQQFDMVLLVHVLEHLNAPMRSLQRIRELLRPGGCLYVEVPNFGAPHAAPGKIFHFAHIYNFTETTLRLAGERSGFRVKQVLSAGSHRDLAVIFERSETPVAVTQSSGYDESVAALTRFNRWTYHLRFGYVGERLRTAVHQRSNRWFSQQRLAAILNRCEKHDASPQPADVSAMRRAA